MILYFYCEAHVYSHSNGDLSSTCIVITMRDAFNRSALSGKYCPFPTTTRMRTMAPSSDRVDGPPYIDREKIRISQTFMEILGFGSRLKFW